MNCRKRYLSWAGITLALASLFTGCGGGGSEEGTGFRGLTETPADVTIAMPTSRSYGSLAELKVWTSLGEDSPNAAGAVSVDIYNNGPQYTEVRDADGNLVAAGFVGKERSTIDFASTAELFIYFAIGGPLQRGSDDAQTKVLDGIRGFAGFDTVVDAVRTTFESQGYVSADDAAVAAAVNTFRDALFASRAPTGRGPDVSPTKVASGLELNNDVNDQIQIKNTAFRRGYMWLIRTGFKDVDGNERTLDEMIVQKEIDVPGRWGKPADNITGIINGDYLWDSVLLDPLPVSSDIADVENEAEVYYDLVTIGVGRLPGDFEALTGEQIAMWEENVYKTCYLDFYLPVYANLVLPLDGAAMDSVTEFAEKHSDAKAFFTSARTTLANIAAETAKGNFPGGLRQFISTSQRPMIDQMTEDIMKEWGTQFGDNLFRDQQDLINRVERATDTIATLSLADAVFRMSPLQDFANADQANVFQITSAKSNVRLVADAEEIGLTDTANIEAIVRNAPNGATFRYEWTVSPNGFFLQDVDGNSTDESPGGLLKSPHAKVFIGNLTNNEGTPTIVCKVYNGNTLVGTASTRVAFKDKVREGTGRLRVMGVAEDRNGDGNWNESVAVFIEVDSMENAAHYHMVAEKANGEDIKRVNWAPSSPPYWPWSTALLKDRANGKFWISIDGYNSAGGFQTKEQAEQRVAQAIAQYNAQYATAKFKITVYFD